MRVPPQTDQIFKILSQGKFINYNSTDSTISELYKIIDERQNFEALHNYFNHIGFQLEGENGYFYFSRSENKTPLERKISKAYEWIDILDLLKTFNNSFAPGYRFTPAEFLTQLKTNIDLEKKLDDLSAFTDKDSHQEIFDKILKKLSDDQYIEIENKRTGQYKVLASFHYLKELIEMINIPEDAKNEIPE